MIVLFEVYFFSLAQYVVDDLDICHDYSLLFILWDYF